MRRLKPHGLLFIAMAGALFLLGCTPGSRSTALVSSGAPAGQQSERETRLPAPVAATSTAVPTTASTATSAATVIPTTTPPPSPTAIPSPTATVTPVSTATPDRTIACSQRVPTDDLFTVVTLTYGLSREYQPADLVPLADYLSNEVTLGYPTEIRAVMAQPLVRMVTAMQEAGLAPTVISGYRSYSAQAIANEKWRTLEPERASILSAPPGYSEHQLGTVVDFGSPELPTIVGQDDVEFHTWFYETGEGIWLLENAHRYGFTLSYPREAQIITGFFYEPWHWRFVGVEMATRLKDLGLSLTEHQLQTEPPPCVPDRS